MATSKHEYHTSIDLGALGELDCIIHFNYSPGTPDRMYLPNGDPGYPGDPSEVDILSLEWPCDSGYLQATFDHLTEHDQEALLEECEAYAIETLSEHYEE